MTDPRTTLIVLAVAGYPEHETFGSGGARGVAERVAACIAEHPTLSIRSGVQVKLVDLDVQPAQVTVVAPQPDPTQATIDEIAARLGAPPGATLTYRGLWDLDLEHRRLHFGGDGTGGHRSTRRCPLLAYLDPHHPDATWMAAKLILAWLDMEGMRRG